LAGSSTITLNTVSNLSSATPQVGTGASAAVLGISQTSTTASQNVSQNVIHSLSSTASTAAVNLVGLHYTGATTGTNLVARNLVHSLALATTSTAASIVGINAAGGAVTYQNNMARLGIDAAGSSLTTAYAITGIAKAGAVNNNFWFNSVYIGGTGVGTTAINTYAFRRTTTGVDSIRDNIFANVRSNATTGGKHYASVLNAATTATSDYNIYNVAAGSTNLFSLDGGTTTIGSLQALRGAPSYGQDLNSGVGNPNFFAPNDPAATVTLKVQSTTPAEGSGVNIASVMDDQEGETRSGLTPVDIGADAGPYSMDASADIFTPQMSYTPFTNTSLTGDRTLSATITDAGVGVPTSGTNVPRIWYKKSTDLSWTLSRAGVLQSGSGQNGTWNFTIVAADFVPPLAIGDVIQYYVVAQDQATTPNLWYNPFAANDPVHSDVNTQTTPPASPNSYTITGTLAGTYYVPNDPDGGGPLVAYPSLSGPGGFFAAANVLTFTGNETVIINGDVTEDGTNKLNQWLEDGAGGYTLTIQPDGATLRTISGTAVATGAAMIDLNGADRVVIDGRSGGSGQYLLFRNTNATAANTGATIQFTNGSSNITLRNCIIENNGSTTTRGAVVLGSTGTNSDILITANDMRDATGGTIGSPANGMYSNSANNLTVTVSNSNIYNWTSAGVLFTNVGSGATIQGNSLYNNLATPPATTQTAISLAGAGDGNTISGNFIGGQAPGSGAPGTPWTNSGAVSFTGINLATSGTATPSQIQGNTIQNIRLTGAGAAAFTGIAGLGSAAVNIGTTSGNAIGHPTAANSIEITGATTGAIRGISVSSLVAMEVSNNLVANVAATNALSTAAFKGIEYSGPTNVVSSFQNNAVRGITLSGTGASTFAGISTTGMVNVGGTTGNTVGDAGSSSSIQLAGSSTTASSGIALSCGTTLVGFRVLVANNVVAGISTTGNARFNGVDVSTSAATLVEGNTVQSISMSNTGTSAAFRGLNYTGATSMVRNNLVGHPVRPEASRWPAAPRSTGSS
jgi:hypothetical protein